MAKKIVIIVGSIIAIAVIGFCGYLYSLKVRIDRGDLVKWNNQWYTKEALEQIIPPQVYEVESKNTPEEVYAKFREALLKDDIDGALSYVRLEKREIYRKDFNDKAILEKYKKMPVVNDIKKSEKDSNGNFASFYYLDDNNYNKVSFSVEFIKNDRGYWEINFI